MDTTQLLTYVSLILGVLGTVIGVLNHKKLRVKCCGRVADLSIDIGDTTPQENPLNAPAPIAAPVPVNK